MSSAPNYKILSFHEVAPSKPVNNIRVVEKLRVNKRGRKGGERERE